MGDDGICKGLVGEGMLFAEFIYAMLIYDGEEVVKGNIGCGHETETIW